MSGNDDETVTAEEYDALVNAGRPRWGQAADITWFSVLDHRQREQTTATIMAALIARGAPLEVDNLVLTAVMMTDALRDALAKVPSDETKCRACGERLVPASSGIADCCPCNSPRGVNHGLVPPEACTCAICDPAKTGASRAGLAAVKP